MQNDEMIETMAKALGYRLACNNADDDNAYNSIAYYWGRFITGDVTFCNFRKLVGYHRAIKEIELNSN